jgi:hypothetical protein
MVFFRAPNAISEDTVKETVDNVLQKLKKGLIENDSTPLG